MRSHKTGDIVHFSPSPQIDPFFVRSSRRLFMATAYTLMEDEPALGTSTASILGYKEDRYEFSTVDIVQNVSIPLVR